MPQRAVFEGKTYEFPDDATPEEINGAMNQMHAAPAPVLKLPPPTALPTDRPSVFTPPRPKGPTLQGPLVPLKQLADSRVGSAVAALNTVNPAAAIARKAASTPFGREVMGAMTGGPAPTGPVGNRDLLRAGLAQAEQFTSPENAALLGMTAIPGVGPALGATMGVQGAAELGTQQLPEIAGSLIGGDPQGAAAQVPAALTNAAFTAIGGRHGFNPAPGRPLAARAPEAFEVPSRFARETAVERSTEGGFDPVQRVQPGAPPVGPRPLTRDAGPLPKPAADLLAFLESDQVGRGLPHLPPPTLRRPQVTRPIPEAPATLEAQLAGLANGDRPAVYIPPGSAVPKVPQGLDVVTLGQGPEARSMVFDPRRYTRYDASHALQSDQGIARMLGKAVDSYPPAGAPQKAVVTRAPDGTEIDATQVDARRPDQLQAEAQAQRAKAPGADVGLEDVDFTAFERWLESQQPRTPPAPPSPPAPAPRPRRNLSDLDAGDLPRFEPRQGPRQKIDLLAPFEPKPEPSPMPVEAPRVNPFAEKAAQARERLAATERRAFGGEAGAKAEHFPLGYGFESEGKMARGIDRTVRDGVELTNLRREAEQLESQGRGFDEGRIDEQGRPISAQREQRQATKQGRAERIAAAKAERAGKEPWQVRADTYADASGNLGGSGRELVRSDHRGHVERAVAEGKPVPPEVLAEYPDLAPRPEARKAPGPGRESVVRTERGTEVPTRFRVVDASELVTSHDADLRANERYPQELQPRDRGRAASEDQVQRISSALDPERLGESRMASDGAPIVGPDLVVESGNGRTIGIRRAYAAGRGEGYRSWLSQNAERFGIRPEDLAGKREPVLVRERVGDVDRAAFAREANESAIAEMSAPERAVSDSRRISPEMMARFAPDESGNLMAATNRDFVRSFMETIPASERGSFMATDGTLSATGATRMRNAIFHSAYGDTRALERLAESTDDNVRSVTAALVAAAPDFASARAAAERGEAHAVDVAPDVVTAAETLSALRAEGMPVEMYLDQGTMFEDAVSPAAKQILRVVEQNKRSPKRLADFFRAIVDETQRAGDPRQGDMFGVAEPPSKQAVIEAAARRVAREPEPQQGKMFGLPERPTAVQRLEMPTSHTPLKLSGTSQLKPGEARTSRQEILDHISEGLGTPIRAGRLGAPKTVAGWFKPEPDIARIRKWGDLETTAHEAGHAISHKMSGWKGAPISAKTDLHILGKQLYGSKQPAGGYFEEGFAEYVAKWVRGEDTAAAAPKFDPWFRQNADPKTIALLESTKTKFDTWQDKMGPAERIGSMIHGLPRGVARLREVFKAFSLDDVIERVTDSNIQMKRFSEAAAKQGEVLPSQDAYKMATLLEGTVEARVKHMVEREMVDFKGETMGPSLVDAIKPVRARLADWKTYAIAKRAVMREALKLDPGLPDMEDAHATVAQLESPEFRAALDAVTKWSDGLLRYLVDAGGMSPEAYLAMRAANPVYVPFKRHLEGPGVLPSGKRGYVNQANPVKQLRGASARPIVDPIEALVMQASQIVRTANKVRVARALAETAEPIVAGVRTPREGMAKWAEHLPADKVPHSFQMADIKKQLEASGADLTQADLDATLTVFEQAFRPKGSEPIVTLWRNGKREFWQLEPKLYETITQMDRDLIGPGVRFLGALGRSVRLGATGLNLEFILRNAFADIAQFTVSTKGGVAEGLKNYGKTLKEQARGGSEELRRTHGLGLELSGMYGQDRAAAGTAIRQATKTDRGVIDLAVAGVDHVREAIGFIEQTPRVAEFKAALQRAEAKYGKGSLDAFIEAGLAYKDVTVNFTRAGTWTRALNQITPFLGARVQGASKLYRTLGEPAAWRNGTAQVAALRAFAQLSVPAVALWLMNRDKEWYQELTQQERDDYWWFGDDERPIQKYRKPHTLAKVFSSMPEAAFEEMYRKDSKAAEEAALSLVKDFAIIPVITAPVAGQGLLEGITNVKTFPEIGPIVPRYLEGKLPEDQFTAYTTESAKMLGRTFGVSPLRIEHAIGQSTGGMAVRLARTAEAIVKGDELVKDASDLPAVGTLFPRPKPGRSVAELYDARERLRQEKGSGVLTKPDLLKRVETASGSIAHARDAVNQRVIEPRQGYREMNRLAREALGKEQPAGASPLDIPRMAKKKTKQPQRDLLAPIF